MRNRRTWWFSFKNLKELLKKSPEEELFFEKYREVYWIYKNIFYEELKDTAEEIWLSKIDRKELAQHGDWDDFTDFFSKLKNEFSIRKSQKYYDLSDLMNPYTGDLRSQITWEIIKKVRIRENITMKYFIDDKRYEFFREFYWDYPKLKEIYENDWLSDFLKTKIPYDEFKESIKINISEEEIKELYIKIVWKKYTENKPDIKEYYNFFQWNIYLETLDSWCTSYSYTLEKYLDDEEKLTKEIQKYEKEFEDYFISFQPRSVYDLPMRRDFDNFFVKFYEKCQFYLENNSTLLKFYYQYTRRKFNLFNKSDLIERFEISETVVINNWESTIEWEVEKYSEKYREIRRNNNREVIFWYKILSELIEKLPHESNEYMILSMLKIIYFDVRERDDWENYIQEIIYRCKKISNTEFLRKEALNDYILSILSISPLNEEEKDQFLKNYWEDIKLLFWDKYLNYLKITFLPRKYKLRKKSNIRTSYTIWLIFGDKHSKKAFELYCKDKRSNSFFENQGLTRKQFITLAEEFSEQQTLDITEKINKWKINFVLIFEMDHETKLAKHTLRAYPNHITICNHPKQHFSKDRFEEMVNEWISKYEWILK